MYNSSVTVTAPYMPEAAQQLGLTHQELLDQLRYWYNGYSWDGVTYVYNPFSILSFFRKADFRNFWFETGTPTLPTSPRDSTWSES